jgi:hypothetical protein
MIRNAIPITVQNSGMVDPPLANPSFAAAFNILE